MPRFLDKNENLTYIPTYEDIFHDDVQEMTYIAEIIRENLEIRDRHFKTSN